MGYGLTEKLAREKAGMGDDWGIYRMQWLPKDAEPDSPGLFMHLTGAVAPIFKSGPRKGQRNWKAMDKTTERIVVIYPHELDAYKAEHERWTGICSKCDGKTTFLGNACKRCKGSGRVADPVPS